MKDIFTIGYSGFKIDKFIEVLKKYKINSLIDVRSNPNSKFYEDYNQSKLESLLKLHGIIYRDYKDEFGARQKNLKYYINGYLDFKEYVKCHAFLEGVRKIKAGMKLNYSFVFMCAEKDPSMCHRNIMVAREFDKLGYNIKNILSDGSYESQESIEQRLVNQYFPNRNQLTFFYEKLNWSDMVNKSYEYRNGEIGYRMDEKHNTKKF
ncbi:DUF488 family protein [Anaerophilus nitritogenes]|uniref:DUF488 domain-containing protein n=1 Tax=Anaerophilus nitritogenes TaxID=2498136 RepID=UPI00101C4B99|nr:DUF488 domain-containing protein [Anaerophilus nitritogenes]